VPGVIVLISLGSARLVLAHVGFVPDSHDWSIHASPSLGRSVWEIATQRRPHPRIISRGDGGEGACAEDETEAETPARDSGDRKPDSLGLEVLLRPFPTPVRYHL
jgi:hypothetical protein